MGYMRKLECTITVVYIYHGFINGKQCHALHRLAFYHVYICPTGRHTSVSSMSSMSSMFGMSPAQSYIYIRTVPEWFINYRSCRLSGSLYILYVWDPRNSLIIIALICDRQIIEVWQPAQRNIFSNILQHLIISPVSQVDVCGWQ